MFPDGLITVRPKLSSIDSTIMRLQSAVEVGKIWPIPVQTPNTTKTIDSHQLKFWFRFWLCSSAWMVLVTGFNVLQTHLALSWLLQQSRETIPVSFESPIMSVQPGVQTLVCLRVESWVDSESNFFLLSHEPIWINTWGSAQVVSWFWVNSLESCLSHKSIWINTWGSAWVVRWFSVNSLESRLSSWVESIQLYEILLESWVDSNQFLGKKFE